MSDNIPFEIQIEIIKRLPVKSLIQFRSVSKAWKSLIDSSDFIAHYRGQLQRILVGYVDDSFDNIEQKYVSIVDDDTFPNQRVPVTVHLLVSMLRYPNIVGSSHGLLCLYWRYLKDLEGPIPGRGIAVLWNFSIKKAVAVVVPNVEQGVYATVLGFGVCRETTDPKIVKITCLDKNKCSIDRESMSCIPCQVEVFTLSTGVWRRQYSNLPRKSIRFSGFSVVVDGLPYWLADDVEPGFSTCNLIMSFDMTSEEFGEVNLPDSLAHPSQKLLISKIRDSLIVLESDYDMIVLVVWMMKDGDSKSFTKLFTINTDTQTPAYIHEFRNNGEPIFEGFKDYYSSQLVVYKPCSKHFDNIGIDGSTLSFSISSYIETLLLLDKPDLTVYNENETLKYRDDLFQELGMLHVI